MSFPDSTIINKRLSKQLFYDNLNINKALRRKFIDQIISITWRNKIAESTVNVPLGKQVNEIQVFELLLNSESLDEDVLNVFDTGMPYHIVFILICDKCCQLRIAYKQPISNENAHFKVVRYYETPWLDSEPELSIAGLTLDAVYESFIRQIAADGLSYRDGDTIQDSVNRDIRTKQLQKQISVLQSKVRKERQLNKQVELNTELKRLIKELEDM